MKYLLPVLMYALVGCRVPPTVEAPIDIYVEGKSDAKPMQVVSLPNDKYIYWSIQIIDHHSEKGQPKGEWTFINPSVKRETVLVNTDNWECVAYKRKPTNDSEMIHVECYWVGDVFNRHIGVMTRGVGCGEMMSDSVDVEREDLQIYIRCEPRMQ